MDLKSYEKYAERCFRDAPPPCASRCPFGLDVRKFVKKMQRGSYSAAYRAYCEAVPFPAIISAVCTAPCQEACVRAKKDRAVSLRELEAACIRNTRDRKPVKYTLPVKEQHIAVVGGGLSGLACAWRMSSWGYRVTVYEKDSRLGGAALEAMDAEVCRAELENAFSVYDCEFVMGREIASLEEAMKSADAVYLATGRTGTDFGLLADGGSGDALGTRMAGVFLGGQRRGDISLTDAACDGLHAANSIEIYFKIGSMDDAAPKTGARPVDERYYALTHDDAQAKEGDGPFDPVTEANRCYLCNCDNCYRACPLMQQDSRYPKRMCNDIIATLKPNMSRRTSVRMLASCTACGKCKAACPEHIDMGACLIEARKDLKEDGHLAPGFHDYWMRDLEFSLSKEAYLVWAPDRGQGSEVVFFPGCQLGASQPEAVMDAYDYIAKTAKNAALYLGCCGIPAEWAGEYPKREAVTAEIRRVWEELGRPLFLPACTACEANLKRWCPEIETCSLYRWMELHPERLPKTGSDEKKPVRVFDPCGAAGDPQTAQAVRSLIASYGGQIRNTAPDFGCCGFGGHIYPANPALFKNFAQSHITQAGEETIAYCANCRDVFASYGEECRHVLDLVFGRAETRRMPPDLGARRDNRRMLRQHYTGEASMKHETALKIAFPEEIRAKMNRLLILDEEVVRTLEACEENGRKLYDSEKGLYYAHHQFENMTVWAVYKQTGDEIEITDVYSHRVRIKE